MCSLIFWRLLRFIHAVQKGPQHQERASSHEWPFFQVPVYIKFANVLLAKASQMASPDARNCDADPGPQGPCVVAVMNKFTRTTEILWRKRDGMATIKVREGMRSRESPLRKPDSCPDRLLLLFWAHYIGDAPHLVCTGSL